MALHPLLPVDPPPAHEWQKLAAAQRGLITFAQLLALGLNRAKILRLLRAGHLTVVHDSVFLVAGAAFDWTTGALAAVLAPHRPAYLAGDAALWHQGLRKGGEAPAYSICVEGRARALLGDDITVHRTLSLPECDHMVVDGIPCLTPARICVDRSLVLDLVELAALIDDIIGARLAKRTQIHARAVALLKGRPRCQALVELTQPGAEGIYNSWLERTGATAMRAGGLPEAQWNVPIHDSHGGFLRLADAWFPAQRINVELDGPRFHRTTAQQANDRRIDRRAGIDGILVLRYGYADVVNRPGWMVAEIRTALEARS